MTASAAVAEECGIYEPAPAAFAGRQISATQPIVLDRSLFMISPLPSWWTVVRAQLNDLGSLPAGWDSYGAPPIRHSARIAAMDILKEISNRNTPRPSIVPTSDGSVQIEWHAGGIDLEVRVLTPTRIAVSLEDEQGQAEAIDQEYQYDFRPLVRAIDILSNR